MTEFEGLTKCPGVRDDGVWEGSNPGSRDDDGGRIKSGVPG